MFEQWKLQHFDPGAGEEAGCARKTYDDGDWLQIDVPGDVHRTLIANGDIPDPFYDQNERECAWMEEKEWWYRVQFDAPQAAPAADERLQLVFNGVDTFATIWLNGEKLGQTNNMFHPWAYDVTDKLQYGESNTLAICFDPPLSHVTQEEIEAVGWGRNPERVYMRKAQFGYGWDWGPRLPTIGLWLPVELRYERKAAIAGTHFYTLELNQTENQAVVALKVEVDRFATEEPLTATLKLTGDNTIEKSLTIQGDAATAYLVIDDPKLWWTHDLGEPFLYTLSVTLSQGDEELATQTEKVGIRTIELDESVDTDEPGTRFFRFVLNGVPIFARGADWIPADSFVGAIPDSHYQKQITAARDANMNMLRIWGGGIYEHELFYDLCDEMGILVWQDFMFACAPYPEDEAFAESVRAEALYQVRRLRSRASLALWCGNNENQWLHERNNWQKGYEQAPGALYYHHILPEVVAEWDGHRAYWPGSPYGGNDHSSMLDGNRHNWEVWHGNGYHRHFGEEPARDNTPEAVSYLRYAEDMGRFISEFGMHAAPVRETLERVIPEDQRYHHSPSMDHHNKDNPKNKGDNLMIGVTGLPETLDDYIDYSMIAQAEGLKFGIEHFRQRKPHCSGTLIWQFNDCWPVLSWSLVDYYGFGKASYYYMRRTFAPVLASFKVREDDKVELWVTNDSLETIQDTAVITLRTFTGHILAEIHEPITVGPNQSKRIRSLPVKAGNDRYLMVHSTNGLFYSNRHFFVMVKDLQRDVVPVSFNVKEVSPNELEVELSAEAFAYFVHLNVPHEFTYISDNFFDLEAGETKVVRVVNNAYTLSADDITISYR
ncbi:glycoside hydrolase family 2 protein [Phototrophicus methaneseepsis]|uniref:Beta-mannosidase B n=1 Tax=Phototrophicus methaneseepsis TaxID=2710758 RepID=A0A7S8EAC1_9CHLR|nr:glycoside hydrolase family 2 protein [Phototrophicus methaneseepsis]QPC83320.1 glycoside hydrolase family 2 protein [Phototrophicus methaneseepsis]